MSGGDFFANTRHPCPCTGCAVDLPRHLLMCRPHWRRVPRALAAEVNDAWRAHTRAPDKESLIRYVAAREAAIRSVGSQRSDPVDAKEAPAPC